MLVVQRRVVAILLLLTILLILAVLPKLLLVLLLALTVLEFILGQHSVAMSSASRPTLVGYTAPFPQNIHPRFSVQSTTANLGLMDKPNLRTGIHITNQPESASNSNCNDRRQSLLALAQITHARRFLAVSKSNTFADARPEIDAVPVTVLLETATLLRCSLPPISNSPVLDTIYTSTSTTFKDYVTTLPTWEQDLLFAQQRNPPLFHCMSC
jgi:hypothetical protein